MYNLNLDCQSCRCYLLKPRKICISKVKSTIPRNQLSKHRNRLSNLDTRNCFLYQTNLRQFRKIDGLLSLALDVYCVYRVKMIWFMLTLNFFFLKENSWHIFQQQVSFVQPYSRGKKCRKRVNPHTRRTKC